MIIGLKILIGKNMRIELNKFSNFTTNVDGIEIHFIKEKGSGQIQHLYF